MLPRDSKPRANNPSIITALNSPLHKQPQTDNLTFHIYRDCLAGISGEAPLQNNNHGLREKTLKQDLLFRLELISLIKCHLTCFLPPSLYLVE